MDREDGAAVPGSPLSRRPRIGVAVVAAVGLAAVGASVALAVGPPPALGPTPTIAPSRSVAAPSPPASVPVATTGSDGFDGWVVGDAGGARYLATDDRRTGSAALLVTRADGAAPPAEPAMTQDVSVAQDSRIRLSFWAASSGSSGDGAVQVRIGMVAPAVVALPGGAFGWTRYTADWTVPPRVVSARITIVATGTTSGTRIDDVAVQGQGSRGVAVADGGFETNSAAVVITDTSLVRRRTDALHLRTRLDPGGAFTWRAEEYTGGDAVTGRGRFEGDEAILPLTDFPDGYYALTLGIATRVGTVERSVDLVVTGAPPSDPSGPLLGVGVHLGAQDGQLQQKVGDLAALGLRAARTDAPWASLEPRPGEYDFSGLDPVVQALQQASLRPLLIPGYGNPLYDGGHTPSSPAGVAAYARFTAALAAHYPDADVDVYNEFDWRGNSSACGSSPQCYLTLLKPTAAAVRAGGPAGQVAGPDISGIGVQQQWMQAFIDGGGLDAVDALDLHPYVQPARPDLLDDQLAALQTSLTAAGKPDLPVWFTEFGDSTAERWLTERRQAEDAARIFGVAAAHGVDRIYWYDAIDDGPEAADLEDRFGLFRAPTWVAPAAFAPKPAAAVLATAARMGAGRTTASSAVEEDVRTVRFDGVALRWSADDGTHPADGVHDATSMTGRPMARSTTAGSAPEWVPTKR